MTAPAPQLLAAGAATATAADVAASLAARPTLTLLQGGLAASALVDRQASARDRIAAGTLTLISRQWDTVLDPRDPEVIDTVSRGVLTLIQGGQSATANVTAAYLRSVLTQITSRHVAYAAAGAAAGVVLQATLRGIQNPEQAYWRPFEQWRYLRSTGVPDDVAKERARRRLLIMADTDLTMAMREGARQTLEDVEEVTGYRRVIHPEESRGGTCGLCLAASDRVYHRGDLLPIHARCCCEVMPRTRSHDPGHELNQDDLARLYTAAGDSTAGPDLKKVQVRDHGELGPVLTPAGQSIAPPQAA
ncbi:hypothetical protein GCM10023201_41030 [Actinomycetospora corticicola]|uniref:Uncharacterized protein n=1 Tax=Actinomycetospora corticicola TaxID=663602 RepID=A0A7Y9DX56_9PSEU|nr:hypothetical protein [Actinomycetospora corticicola]NYD36812.1 hypothetical protein [Actinomycetospora corticicola]